MTSQGGNILSQGLTMLSQGGNMSSQAVNISYQADRGDQIAFIGDKHHRPDGLRIDYGRPEEEFKVLSSLKPNQLL